jgi:hypothetical protein
MDVSGCRNWGSLGGAGVNGKRSGAGDHGSETPAARGGARPFPTAQGEEGIVGEPDGKAKALPLPTALPVVLRVHGFFPSFSPVNALPPGNLMRASAPAP